MFLSSCCGSPALTKNGKEGTNYFLCSCCQKPCDAHEDIMIPKSDVEILENKIKEGLILRSQPKITTLSTKYKITHKQKEIVVEKGTDGRLTITPMGWVADKGFVFINSKPETVKAIGELLIKASEL